MKVFLLLTVAYCTGFNTDNLVAIVLQLKEFFHPEFVYLLLHGTEEYTGIVRLEKLFSARNVQVAAASFVTTEAIFRNDNRPLFVLTSGRKSIKPSIIKYFQYTKVSNAVWLLFLDNNMRIQDFFTDMNIPFDCEFLVAQEEGDNTVILTEVYRISSSHPLQTFHFGKWTQRTVPKWPTNGLYRRRSNLQELVIKSSVNNSLFVTVKTVTASKPVYVGGYIGEVWHTLESLMNFTSDYYYHREWRDVVKMIHSGAVDVSIADILMKPQDLAFAQFIAPLVNVRTHIMIRTPSKTEVPWTNFLMPFSSGLWVAVMGIMVIIATGVTLTETATRYCKSNEILKTFSCSYLNSFFCIFATFCQQGHSSTAQTTSSQIVFLTSHLTAVVLLASYSGSLISSLTVRRPTLPFETFQQMLEDGSYHLDVLSNSGEMDYFRLNEDELMQQIYQKLIAPQEDALPTSILEGLQRVCSRHKHAYFASLHGVMALLRNLSCSPVLVPRAYVPGTISMSIARNSPFRGIFKYNIQNMRRAGVLQKLLHDAFPAEMPLTEMTLHTIDLETARPIFTLLAAGILLSILVLVIEIQIYPRR